MPPPSPTPKDASRSKKHRARRLSTQCRRRGFVRHRSAVRVTAGDTQRAHCRAGSHADRRTGHDHSRSRTRHRHAQSRHTSKRHQRAEDPGARAGSRGPGRRRRARRKLATHEPFAQRGVRARFDRKKRRGLCRRRSLHDECTARRRRHVLQFDRAVDVWKQSRSCVVQTARNTVRTFTAAWLTSSRKRHDTAGR